MRRRLENLRRLVAIKEQQQQSTKWKLARLETEERAALDDEAAIIAALNAEQLLHGLFVGIMAKHLRAVSERIGAIRTAQAKESARLRKETGEMRHSERTLVDAERRYARLMEEKRLAELIEATTARDAQASRKLRSR